MRQLQFIEKGKLEWRDVPDPKLGGDKQRPLSSGFETNRRKH